MAHPVTQVLLLQGDGRGLDAVRAYFGVEQDREPFIQDWVIEAPAETFLRLRVFSGTTCRLWPELSRDRCGTHCSARATAEYTGCRGCVFRTNVTADSGRSRSNMPPARSRSAPAWTPSSPNGTAPSTCSASLTRTRAPPPSCVPATSLKSSKQLLAHARFRKLTQKWVGLELTLSQLRLEQARREADEK